MTEGERIVDLFLVRLVRDTKASLAEKEKAKAMRFGRSWNGNSRLWGTIKAKRIVKDGITSYQLVMADYYYWVDKGRDPGNVSKGADIEGWVKRKGLNPVRIISEMREAAREGKVKRVANLKKPTFAQATKQMGYLVRRKLTAKGYEANRFYTSVINDGRLVKLREDYKTAVGKDLVIEIKNIVNGGNGSI